MAGNVNLIDPHNSNINTNVVNGIPQYQDMYISAELIAIKRGRTVLSTNINGSFTKFHEKSDNTSSMKVSFLGENQKQDQFTTNWYEGSVGDEMTQFEGFGIGNINILVNSSYIPQIDIEFIDVRGFAFFNRENSPYRILFDFPPPIFYLSFKGYYGKAITYQMHLVKYTTEFKSDSGNYNIQCKFIAISYAPLTDVLFRHIVQVAIFGKDYSLASLSPDTSKPPVNTLDLILKLKNLYSSVGKKIKSDIDNQRYNNAQKSLTNYLSVYELLAGYYNNAYLKKQGTPILFTYDVNDDDTNINIIRHLKDYDGVIKEYKSLDIPNYVGTHLYVGFLSEVNTNSDDTNQFISKPIEKQDVVRRALLDYKTHLIKETNSKLTGQPISENDFRKISTITDNKSISSTKSTDNLKYIGLDVTYYYFKLYRKKSELEEKKSLAMTNLNDKINAMIQIVLGMKPTIYNIFKVLLDDVDVYFQKLRDVSIEAQKHHEANINNIINDFERYKDKKQDNNKNNVIFPFPLVVESEARNCLKTEVRRAPTKLSEKLDTPFPELVFIQEFIDSFILTNQYIKQYTLKSQQDAQGDNIWIPFTPLDSLLVTFDQRSPYWGTDTRTGGIDTLPIDLSSLNKLNRIFEIMLTRFYVFSQNTIPYTFYGQTTEKVGVRSLYNITPETTNEYIKLYASAEAVNLANSMFNIFYLKMLKFVSFQYKNNPDEFYIYLEKNLNSLYTGTPSSYLLSNTDPIYVTKNNIVQYKGLKIISGKNDIEIRTGGGKNKFIDEFYDDFVISLWDKIWTAKRNKETAYDFTSENLIYMRDHGKNGDEANDLYRTKFLTPIGLELDVNNQYSSSLPTYNKNQIVPVNQNEKNKIINKLLLEGNQYFFQNKSLDGVTPMVGNSKANDKNQNDINFIDIWVEIFNIFKGNKEFQNKIIKSKGKLTELMYLSNFGTTAASFNYYPYYLNQDYFTTPSMIETPSFLAPYMGLLLSLSKNEINEIKEFFTEGLGKLIPNSGFLIFADIYDVNKYLAIEDINILKEVYVKFQTEFFNSLANNVENLYDEVQKEYINCINKANNKSSEIVKCDLALKEQYRNKLNGDYRVIPDTLTQREVLVCYNEITFRFAIDNGIINVDGNYNSLKKLNFGETLVEKEKKTKKENDLFFKTFFQKLDNEIVKRINEEQDIVDDFKRSAGDEDIATQLYYTFKNINDKWLAGLSTSIKGYPFNDNPNNGLIGQFAFVDRAMNPIGDTIINPETLIEALDDPHATIFTVISQLLSLNGFEFFPLQSFLKFQDKEWEESFLIDSGPLSEQYPVFVCMYIGGSASYPTGIQSFSDFEEDGIIDIANPGVSDFNMGDCNEIGSPDDQQLITKNHDVYSEVRAFKVRFGEQNQSMFTNIAIDSKEYPETDESIQILAQLAGDNKEQAPIPKAQNLYNLYENRSYQATVTSLGNAMIQPTQYFQLENIPLYNGAYIILSVEHKLTPNTMMTTFTGTKLLKYPMPRVLEPSSIVGFEGGSTTNTNASLSNDVTKGRDTGNNPEAAQYNSMYNLKIQ